MTLINVLAILNESSFIIFFQIMNTLDYDILKTLLGFFSRHSLNVISICYGNNWSKNMIQMLDYKIFLVRYYYE